MATVNNRAGAENRLPPLTSPLKTTQCDRPACSVTFSSTNKTTLAHDIHKSNIRGQSIVSAGIYSAGCHLADTVLSAGM